MGIYNADNAYILKPILKCFYMAINLELPACLQNYETLSQWINFFKLLLDSKMVKNWDYSNEKEREREKEDQSVTIILRSIEKKGKYVLNKEFKLYLAEFINLKQQG